MLPSNLNDLWSIAFEIESMLLSMKQRDEATVAAAMPLLKRKVGTLNQLLAESRPAPEPQTAPEPEPEPESEPKAAPAPDPAPVRRHMSLTLNDKFQFQRELFGGSAAQMSDAIALAEELPTLSEVEAYFYEACGWDAEQPVVVLFMQLVRDSFREK